MLSVSIGANVVQSQRFEFAYQAGAVSGDREPDELVWRRGDGATLTHRAGGYGPGEGLTNSQACVVGVPGQGAIGALGRPRAPYRVRHRRGIAGELDAASRPRVKLS
jgi:hypothetical protein